MKGDKETHREKAVRKRRRRREGVFLPVKLYRKGRKRAGGREKGGGGEREREKERKRERERMEILHYSTLSAQFLS